MSIRQHLRAIREKLTSRDFACSRRDSMEGLPARLVDLGGDRAMKNGSGGTVEGEPRTTEPATKRLQNVHRNWMSSRQTPRDPHL
jgi:hypothetical protein